MINFFKSSVKIWNIILFVSILFAAFILPILPAAWHRTLFRTVYTFIFITAVLSLNKKSTFLLTLLALTILTEWISGILGFDIMLMVAKGTNILFFIVIVYLLLKQIATAREVNAEIILGSIIGYLLIGIIYSIFIAIIIDKDPGAFSMAHAFVREPGESSDVSTPLYFVYVTLATVGYGDIVPLKPYARSIANLIAISGQFYIAIIVALLVGKFTSEKES